HTRFSRDWSSDVCSSDLRKNKGLNPIIHIAKRYAFSKSKIKAISIITAISSMGLIVITMALFVVLSVFSGLEEYTKSFTNVLDPDYVALRSEEHTSELQS